MDSRPASAHRFSPVTTMSTLRLPHCEQTSRRRHSDTGISDTYQQSLLCRVRFAPLTTCFAPDVKPEDFGRGGASEGHRRALVGLHSMLAVWRRCIVSALALEALDDGSRPKVCLVIAG
jgi:hypothetical protein